MNQFYTNGFKTAFGHGLFAMLRQRRTQVISIMVLLPAFIPLLEFMPGQEGNNPEAAQAFALMTELLYITVVTPLLALFFAAMLIGEDVESQTIPYILTRPIPREAWLAGRFVAYLVVSSAILFTAIVITFFACLATSSAGDMALGDFVSVFQYQAAATMALLGYGALCTLLGAVVRRPVIVGVLLMFGWQRIALLAPGMTDFFTIEKYVVALMPGGGSNEITAALDSVLEEFKGEIAVSMLSAGLILTAFAVVCLTLTTAALLHREYTTPSAVTE